MKKRNEYATVKYSVIIVFYDDQIKLLKCLNSIEVHSPGNTEVIVVNNSSSTLGIRKEWEYQLKIIDHRRNIGFGPGTNLGIKEAKGEFVILLNPDSELSDDFIIHASELLIKYPRISAVAPKLIDNFGRQQPSAMRFPTCATYFKEAFLLNRFSKRTREKWYSFIFQGHRYHLADWLCGAAIVFRKETLFSVGGFNEDYFMYYEDVDIFKRLQKMGYLAAYGEDFVVRHEAWDRDGFCSEKFNSQRRILTYVKSLLYYFFNNEKQILGMIKFIVFCNSLLRFFAWLLVPIIRSHIPWRAIRQRLSGYYKSMALSMFR